MTADGNSIMNYVYVCLSPAKCLKTHWTFTLRKDKDSKYTGKATKEFFSMSMSGMLLIGQVSGPT